MKKQLIFLFTFASLIYSYAQNTNVSHFKITPKNQLIEIEADFPRTFQNALVNYKPTLEFSKNKEYFKNTYTMYLKENLVLIDKDGKKMELLYAIEIHNKLKPHQYKFLITYKGSNVRSITNTTLFNISKQQINYHVLKTADNDLKFNTTPNQIQYLVPTNFNILNYKYYILGILFFVFLITITIQEYKA